MGEAQEGMNDEGWTLEEIDDAMQAGTDLGPESDPWDWSENTAGLPHEGGVAPK